MEWWEVLSAWQTVNKIAEERNKYNSPQNCNVKKQGKFEKEAKGNIEYIQLNSWKKPLSYSDNVKKIREKILSGVM